jgi:hypothetical protein
VFVELGLDVVDQLLDAGGFHFGAHFGNVIWRVCLFSWNTSV